MIIKTITHDIKQNSKGRKGDLSKHRFIKDADYHPFYKEREYMRALNATKIERMLAKPFVTAFEDHKEGIVRVEKHMKKDLILSSSFDGVTNIYNIATKKIQGSISLGKVSNGVSFYNDDILVSKNKDIYLYDTNGVSIKSTYKCNSVVNFLHGGDHLYVATGKSLQVVDVVKKNVIQKYDGTYTFCKSDPCSNLTVGACGNKVTLIDNRIEKIFNQIDVGLNTNYAAFSPDSRYFVSANEDSNSYLHDLRYVDMPVGTFRHHINAVTSVDYSPCGTEFVSGSYDKTIRIFRIKERKSRDVYYNKRMHHVNGVKYANDGILIVSGSDDSSLRVWKSRASIKLGKMTKKETEAIAIAENLKDKYKNVEEIARISKHRFLPKGIKGEMKNQHEHYLAGQRKKEKYSKADNN